METSLRNHKWHKTFMSIAELIADHSYAERKKVGAILVKDKRIISIGYNGTPAGFDNTCEEQKIVTYEPSLEPQHLDIISFKYSQWVTKPEVLHAESNCISKCAKSTESSEGSDLYVTVSPCLECAKLIIQCGIRNVYYKEKYRDEAGIELLLKAKIGVYSTTVGGH